VTSPWELNVKPAFLADLLALPNRRLARQVQQGVEGLRLDPRPDGHHRKKLKGHKDPVFRLRLGDYRLFYTFGDRWVRLLALRLHHRGYDDAAIGYERPAATPPPDDGAPASSASTPEEEADAGAQADPTPADPAPATTTVRPLPAPLTEELLADLAVPPEHRPALLRCADEDALLGAAVPDDVRLRVVEALFPRPVEKALQEPDLVLSGSGDLVRFAAGELSLKDFLLRLDGDQERAVDWATPGPLLVKGGPGVGKSVTLLYRVRALLEQARHAGKPPPRVLLATYTNALCRFSRHLLGRLIGPDGLRSVSIQTADRLACSVARRHGRLDEAIASEAQLRQAVAEARRQALAGEGTKAVLPPERFRDGYLLDEFAWVIEGRGLTSRQAYLDADRAGRGVRLTAKERGAVWEVYRAYRDRLGADGLVSWGQVRGRALGLVREGAYAERYDAVLVDEAQDLTPLSLGLLVGLCRTPEGACLTADANQSVYSRGFTWRHVDERLNFQGRTVLLRRNYRTTRQITTAAAALLAAGGGGDAEALAADCVLDGPRPLLRPYDDLGGLAAQAAAFLRSSALRLRAGPQAAAVLTPTQKLGKAVAAALARAGVPARYMAGGELDLDADVVKVLTLHSAKGLEFPTAVVAGLAEGVLPRSLPRATPEERKEEEEHARRLAFVGMTRAMHHLLVLYPRRCPSPFVAQLDKDLWDLGGDAAQGAPVAEAVVGR
jgi:superfamily I DNA/RNA helicase/mRNA-degrading endonuclease RelE of RelBE toxin-antitoxin system